MSNSDELQDSDSSESLDEGAPEISDEETACSIDNNLSKKGEVKERPQRRDDAIPHDKSPVGGRNIVVALLMCAAYLMSIPEGRIVQESPAFRCSELGRILHLASCPLMPVEEFIDLMENAVARHSNAVMASGTGSCPFVSSGNSMKQNASTECSNFEITSDFDYCSSLPGENSIAPTEGAIIRYSEQQGNFDSEYCCSKSDEVSIPQKEDSFARNSDLIITSDLDYCPFVSSGNSVVKKKKNASDEWSDFERTSDFDYCSSLPGENSVAPTEDAITGYWEELGAFSLNSCSSKSEEVSIPQKDDTFARYSDKRITSELDYCHFASCENYLAPVEDGITGYSEQLGIFDSYSCSPVSSGNSMKQKKKNSSTEGSDFERISDFEYFSSLSSADSSSPTEDAITRYSEMMGTFDSDSCSSQSDEVPILQKEDEIELDYCPSVTCENSVVGENVAVSRYSKFMRSFDLDIRSSTRDNDSLVPKDTVRSCLELRDFDYFSVSSEGSIPRKEDTVARYANLERASDLNYCPSVKVEESVVQKELAVTRLPELVRAFDFDYFSVPDEATLAQKEEAVATSTDLLRAPDLDSMSFKPLGNTVAQQEDAFNWSSDQEKASLDSYCSEPAENSLAQEENAVATYSGHLRASELDSMFLEALEDLDEQHKDAFDRSTENRKVGLDSYCSDPGEESFAQKEDRVLSENNEKRAAKLPTSVRNYLFEPYNSHKTEKRKKGNLNVCKFCNPCRGARPKWSSVEESYTEEEDSKSWDEFDYD